MSGALGPYAPESVNLTDCAIRDEGFEPFRGVWLSLLGDGRCYLARTTEGTYSVDVYEGNCTDLQCTAQSFLNETAFATKDGVMYYLLLSDSIGSGYGLPLESNYAIEVTVRVEKS
jgi:hypothetical protein